MKIPFERTISSAYRFAFSNLLSVIGIGWFPYLLTAAIVGAALYCLGPQIIVFIEAARPEHKPDPAQIMTTLRAIGALYAIVLPVVLLVSAMVTVGMVRKALGLHPGPVFFFFSLGSQVWRLIGGYILIALLFYGLVIVFTFAIAAIWFALDHYARPAEWPVAVVLGMAAFAFCLYALIRVGFFLPAVVVAENHIGMRRSWRLGRGNFWRIVGIVLMVYIPVSFAASLLTSSIVQFVLGPTMGLPMGPGSPAEFHAILKSLSQFLVKAGPYYLAIQLVQIILLHGLNAGAVASAYLAITEGDASPDLKAAA